MSDLIKGALEWAKMGVPVFPCGGNKAPLTENGFYDAVTDPQAVKGLFDLYGSQAKLIGARMGEASGLFCMDFDLYKGDQPRNYMEKLMAAGQLPDSRCHRTMNGGLHVFYYSDEEWPNLKPCPGVEVKGEGGYVIVPPSPGYEIVDGRQSVDAPAGLLSELHKARDLMSSSSIDELKFAVINASDFHDSLRGIAARLSARGMDPVDVVIELKRILAASNAADPDHARHSRWKKLMTGNDAELSRMVKSGYEKFNSNAQNERLLEVKNQQWEDTAAAVGFFQIPSEGELPEKEVVYDDDVWPFNQGYFASEDRDLQSTDFTLYPIFAEGESVVLFAEPKTGKTAIALTTALHIATGESLGALTVSKGAGSRHCLYYALEGTRAIELRIEAWKKHRRDNGIVVPDNIPLFVVEGYANFLKEESRKDECAKIIAANNYSIKRGSGPIACIYLDTLTKAMSGGDQNSVEDTSHLFETIGILRSGGVTATIIFVHHKARTGNVRGSSNIEAEPDVLLDVSKEEEIVSLRVARARSIEDGGQFLFRLSGVDLGKNKQGFPITGVIAEPEASIVDPSLADTSDSLIIGKRLKAITEMGFKEHSLEVCVRTLHRFDCGPKTGTGTEASPKRTKTPAVQKFFEKLIGRAGRVYANGKVALNLVYDEGGNITGIRVSPVGGVN